MCVSYDYYDPATTHIQVPVPVPISMMMLYSTVQAEPCRVVVPATHINSTSDTNTSFIYTYNEYTCNSKRNTDVVLAWHGVAARESRRREKKMGVGEERRGGEGRGVYDI